ncbi:hypothetical protein M9H77_16043 [Catharanthus roseus]|uniref:Uncharacterized protein n=1 Tax=Catharanthus roseus TaxID=4058 RepID=A0ACC0AZ95_CATRO|nr:hypothetical protein M9H77_16043 [Catharanthus roseus]
MAWGAAILAWLYRNLSQASLVDEIDLGACYSLLRTVARNSYTQQFEPLGTTCASSVLDYRLQMDTIRACEVWWTPYTAQEIEGVRFAIYHGALVFLDTEEPHMPERLSRERVFPSPLPIPAGVVLDALDLYIGDDDPKDVGTSHARFIEISRIFRMYREFRF